MRLTDEQLAAILQRPWIAAVNNPTHPGHRPRSSVQESQDADARQVTHRSKEAKVDGKVHPKYRIAITLLVSDRRRRDGDGAVSTLFDCLVAAIRRLPGLDTGALLRLPDGRKGPGGMRD